MSRARLIADWTFRTKMLIAVTAAMSLLVAVALGLVSQRFEQQIHKNAADQLRTAEGVLRIRQSTREKELLLRFSSVRNEPRLKAIANLLQPRTVLTDEGQKTVQGVLGDMIKAGAADVIVLSPSPDLGQAVAVTLDPRINTAQFAARAASSIQQCFTSRQNGLDIVASSGRLFDVVTLPVMVEDTIAGTITFGVQNSLAEEFDDLMSKDDELVLLLGGQVVSSTLRDHSAVARVPEQFAAMTEKSGFSGAMQEITLNDEQFWGRAGWLNAPDQPRRLGYLILSSYEKPLQILRSTQQTILLIGLLAIAVGIVVVWFLVRKMTGPLIQLQASAEAVGQGDFSRRVDIRTRDEFGRLGRAFNQMTQNIEQSQAQLKQTVETLKTTQAQLIQSEKLSAVGEFVAGVAHELNNPLATVMGFADLLKNSDTNEKNRRHLEMVFKSAQRCQKIVQSLLSFARRQKPERKPVQVNKLIEEVLEVVAYPLRTSNVQVTTQFSPTLPLVLADGHQIQQVVLNIINNARQAIEAHQDSGRIAITTANDAHTVRIVIKDSGPGISPENLRRIFDPFFTTKEVGKGTGLGLSLCYGMIHDHGGNITVTSDPGDGATFTIELPVADGVVSELATASNGAAKVNAREGAGKRILAVDDEESLLLMIQEGLGRHSYRVETASNGEAALHRLRHQKFDLIICDLKMPGLNGRQVYERLRAENPDACRRMVFVTGDIIGEPLRQFFAAEQRPCLAKPFSLDELRETVEAALAKL